MCRKCVNECPTGAIVLKGMDPLPKEPKAPAAKPAAAAEKPATPAVEPKKAEVKESVNEQK